MIEIGLGIIIVEIGVMIGFMSALVDQHRDGNAAMTNALKHLRVSINPPPDRNMP